MTTTHDGHDHPTTIALVLPVKPANTRVEPPNICVVRLDGEYAEQLVELQNGMRMKQSASPTLLAVSVHDPNPAFCHLADVEEDDLRSKLEPALSDVLALDSTELQEVPALAVGVTVVHVTPTHVFWTHGDVTDPTCRTVPAEREDLLVAALLAAPRDRFPALFRQLAAEAPATAANLIGPGVRLYDSTRALYRNPGLGRFDLMPLLANSDPVVRERGILALGTPTETAPPRRAVRR